MKISLNPTSCSSTSSLTLSGSDLVKSFRTSLGHLHLHSLEIQGSQHLWAQNDQWGVEGDG